MPLTREQQVVVDSVKEILSILPTLSTLENQLNEKPSDLYFAANTACVCRKMAEVLDAISKRLGEVEAHVAQQSCKVLEKIPGRRYSTEYATISPNPEAYVKHPTKPEDEGFVDFVQQLPPQAVRPHFPTVMELISDELKIGNQIPFGLKKDGLIGMKFKLRLTTAGKKDL